MGAVLLTSRLSDRFRVTIPAGVREKLDLRPGDQVVFEVDGARALIRKSAEFDIEYHGAIEPSLSEWNSASDDSAFADL